MKLFQLDGTTKDSFSIGIGISKVEFRSIKGILHYKNYGKNWQELRTTNSSLREWSPNSEYIEDELIIHNGSLWVVTASHVSTGLFDPYSQNVAKVADYNTVEIYEANSIDPYILRVDSSTRIIFRTDVDPLIIPDRKMVLPRANGLQLGTTFTIQNTSNIPLNVFYKDEVTLATKIKPKRLSFLTVIENSSEDGVWAIYDVGSGNGLEFTNKKIANYNVKSGELVPLDTLLGTFEVTLPDNPFQSDRVGLIDVTNNLGIYPVTLKRNGKKINGLNEDWEIDINNLYIELVFNEESQSWFFVEVPISGSGGSGGGGSGPSNELELDFTGQTIININHLFNYYPKITILDSVKEEIVASIRHIDKNNVQIILSENLDVTVILR